MEPDMHERSIAGDAAADLVPLQSPDETAPIPTVEPTPAPSGRDVPRFYLGARQAYTFLAAALAFVLVGLIIYLVYLLWPHTFVTKGGKVEYGLKPVMSIEGPGRGDAPLFGQPMGAAFGLDGRIYVADTRNSRVAVFDAQGRYLYSFGSPGIAKPLAGYPVTWKPGLLNYPVAVDVDRATGDVYVADFYNNTIEVFDAKGKWLRRFPDPYQPVGKGSGGFNGGGIAVTDVAVLDGKVYATDTYQVFVFDRWGHLLEQFGKPGLGPGDLDHPNGIAATRDGSIYVSDSNHNRVSAFEADGRSKWNAGFRTPDSMQETKNPFVLPRGLTVLVDGSIVVADPLAMQLVRIGDDGKVMGNYGKRGTGATQFNFPNDVDSQGNLLLVADRGNNRVLLVELVRK
jgi:DNA-binding beta-propeller fold protein YncE